MTERHQHFVIATLICLEFNNNQPSHSGYCGRTEREVIDMEYCHYDYEDKEHDCLDYMECEECPYYYADLED